MEVYGEKPKMFTKAWFGYFWMYYKVWVLLTVLALILMVSFIIDFSTPTTYDMSMMIAGNKVVTEEIKTAVQAEFSKVIDDADGNGEKEILLNDIFFGDSSDPQYLMAQSTKYTLEMGTGDTCLYIFTKEQADAVLNEEGVDDTFLPVSEYAKNVPEDRLMKAMGEPYAVRIDGGELDGCVVMLRKQFDKKAVEGNFRNAKKVAAYLAER
ncbi:MAG: hypothetical protein Q4B31_00755 [Clostridia bacterium]|nr:hypothetical protein [Clostridia bacterium]